MKGRKVLTILVVALGLVFCQAEVSAAPMGTAFTYQGFLMEHKKPANDFYDFQFELYDGPDDGTQVAGPVSANDVNVVDGHLTVVLDFGGNVFDGNALWLQTAVRPGDSNDPCDFVTLSPRQELTPAPYALYAAKAAVGVGVGMQDAIVRGYELTYNSISDVYVEPGTLFHGHTPINKTTRTHLTLAMPTHWWDGELHSYSGGEGWCYIGIDSSGDIRFLADNPPNAADAEGNTEGTKLYWYDGSNYWRVIGAIRVNDSNEVARKWFQRKDTIMWDVPVSLTTELSAGTWSSALSCADAIPAASTIGIFGAQSTHHHFNCAIFLKPNGTIWSTAHANAIWGYDGTVAGQRLCLTDGSQRIQYRNDVGDIGTEITVEGYMLNIR